MIINHNVVNEERRKPLIDLCKTRWAERHSAYQHFYQGYVVVVEALEVIAFRYHLEKYEATYADWDYASRNEAQQILAIVTSFQFVVVFVTIYQYLSRLSGITVKLQSKAVDMVKAHNMISEIVRTYNSERANVERSFSQIYKVSSDMAKKIESTIAMPRNAARQQGNKIAALFQLLLFKSISREMLQFPFLDHIIISINRQLSKSAVTAISLLGLVPSIICSQDVNLEEALIKNRDGLPSLELMDAELKRWRNRYMAMLPEKRPYSPAKAIKECDATDFPNISVLLTIACTIPVTSCECERSASALRRLNNYMHASMGEDRLSHLAFLHIHYDVPIDLDNVVDYYARLHPRRLELDSVLLH
ncbi:52 kDa repressor of the inhibitor of the protein kinase-like [Corticium candelabrum]|uniref:52 kDa repressor of the inhibitor of the protein kinase-like n=1 Tax=Corticium candelabrum TaxID=121492 RepID=UPI002E25CC5E|nr:52 kDa repressor of the inhibitor of the protein kinase-like [Corticium candelabrum]